MQLNNIGHEVNNPQCSLTMKLPKRISVTKQLSDLASKSRVLLSKENLSHALDESVVSAKTAATQINQSINKTHDKASAAFDSATGREIRNRVENYKNNISNSISETQEKLTTSINTQILPTVKQRTQETRETINSYFDNESRQQHSEESTSTPSTENKKNDEEKLSKTIEKLSGKDRVGVTGEALSTAGGAAAGAAAAGTIASAAGATTIFGSSALGSVLGGTFVAATPVGWVIGSAVVAGAAGYGIARMIRSGSEQDEVRKKLIKRLTERLDKLHQNNEEEIDSLLVQINQLMTLLIANDALSEEQANRMTTLLEEGKLSKQACFNRIQGLAVSLGLIELTTDSL